MHTTPLIVCHPYDVCALLKGIQLCTNPKAKFFACASRHARWLSPAWRQACIFERSSFTAAGLDALYVVGQDGVAKFPSVNLFQVLTHAGLSNLARFACLNRSLEPASSLRMAYCKVHSACPRIVSGPVLRLSTPGIDLDSGRLGRA